MVWERREREKNRQTWVYEYSLCITHRERIDEKRKRLRYECVATTNDFLFLFSSRERRTNDQQTFKMWCNCLKICLFWPLTLSMYTSKADLSHLLLLRTSTKPPLVSFTLSLTSLEKINNSNRFWQQIFGKHTANPLRPSSFHSLRVERSLNARRASQGAKRRRSSSRCKWESEPSNKRSNTSKLTNSNNTHTVYSVFNIQMRTMFASTYRTHITYCS